VQKKEPRVEIQYRRGVDAGGNVRALQILDEVFEAVDTEWRGLGLIEKTGLALRQEWADFDAWRRFSPPLLPARENPACRCGDVLRGSLRPKQCPLFATSCSPKNPVGPCMVSSEGSCAAAYRYGA
jgi:hydrogenase expression/formation protein HypD